MGLAGRKEKQRIPADPRNLSWADNAARFGQAYLSKMGWDPSKGLGASGDGMKSHLKVTHKLDMLGIGAAHQKDPHGIAWKQNKDFENLLKRLNENAKKEEEEQGEREVLEVAGDEWGESVSSGANDEERVDEDKAARKEKKKEKKRKRKEAEDGDEGSRKKSRKKRKGEDEISIPGPSNTSNEESSEDFVVVQTPTVSTPASPKIKARPAAHRARIQASKRLASKSAAAISEILGIAPTPSAAPTPLGTLTPIADAEVTLEKLTTSTKSVADYFKEKLGAKSAGAGTGTPQALSEREETNGYEAPRGGLGLGASRMKMNDSGEGSERPRGGIGSSSAAFGQFFAASSLTATAVLETVPSSPEDPSESKANDEVEKESKKRKRKGEDDEDGNEKRDKVAKRKETKYRHSDENAGDSSTIPFPTSSEVVAAAKKDRKKNKKKGREAKEDEVESTSVVPLPTVDDAEAMSKDEKKKRKKEKREKTENADTNLQSAIPFPTIDEVQTAKKEKAERKARKKDRES